MGSRQISIDEVLLRIQECASEGKTFSLKWWRASGKQRGTLKFVAKARYGAPERERLAHDIRRTDEGAYRGERKVSLHVDAGTIPITDLERNDYNTPIVRLIEEFNGMVVQH
jgi:hypothetical protein